MWLTEEERTRALRSINHWYTGADLLTSDPFTIIGHVKRAPEIISVLWSMMNMLTPLLLSFEVAWNFDFFDLFDLIMTPLITFDDLYIGYKVTRKWHQTLLHWSLEVVEIWPFWPHNDPLMAALVHLYSMTCNWCLLILRLSLSFMSNFSSIGACLMKPEVI